MSLDVEINSKQYSLVPGGDGTKVSTRPVQQFVQPIRDTGRTRPEDVAAYESFVVPNLAYGFGRARINSDVAFDPKEYRRFFNSTCDTRWMDRIYLPILAENATQSGLNVVKCSASYKGELHSLWSQTIGSDAGGSGATNRGAVNRLFTGASTDAWENGGYLSQSATVTSMAAGEDETEYAAVVNVTANTDLLVVVVTYTDGANIGNAITGMAYNAASNGSGGTSMDAAVNVYNADTGVGIFYKVNPTASSGSDNYFFCRLNSVSGSAVDEISAVAYHIRGVNTGTLSLATANSVDSSGTTISNAVSTAAGDFVVDGFAGDDNIAVSSSGTGQQSGMAATGTGITRSHKSSYRIATGTTTTMSHTLASSISGDFLSAAAAFAIDPVTPVDITTSTAGLVAMVVQGDDHRTYTSSDGASWSESSTIIAKGKLASDKAADFGTTDPFDAGLFGSVGGELVAAVWDEDDGTIDFVSSTDGGVVWAAEISIRSSNGPQGLATYPGIDSEEKLYLATHEGIYEIDTAPSTWTYQLILPMTGSDHNGRRMTVHEGSLWFAQGVDNDSPAPIYKMTVQGNSRIIESGFGLSYGDGVPSDMLGPVRWMKSSGDQLFISLGGGAANRNARILAWNGKGWHHMYKNTTADQPIDWIDVGSGDDGVPRLHFSMRTGTNTCDAEFLEQPLVNPRSGVSIKRAADGQFIELPYYDLGMPHNSKNFLTAHLSADDLTASHETVEFHYGINGGDRDDVDLGDFTSSVSKIDFASGAGVSAKDIGIMLKLNRNDSTNTNTPKIKDIIIEGAVVPGILYEHQMTIDIEQTAEDTGQSIETVISNIESLVESVIQTQFKFGSVSKYVTLDRERSGFSFGVNSWDAAGAPNALAERTGTFNCVLVEKVAS
tara:strand:+ start:21812 stop:24484 length:2673 start_codon:yes stop_codon:yes gene_type:complete